MDGQLYQDYMRHLGGGFNVTIAVPSGAVNAELTAGVGAFLRHTSGSVLSFDNRAMDAYVGLADPVTPEPEPEPEPGSDADGDAGSDGDADTGSDAGADGAAGSDAGTGSDVAAGVDGDAGTDVSAGTDGDVGADVDADIDAPAGGDVDGSIGGVEPAGGGTDQSRQLSGAAAPTTLSETGGSPLGAVPVAALGLLCCGLGTLLVLRRRTVRSE